MPEPFKDLDDFFKVQPIVLPIRGKKYKFPGSVSGRTGLLLHRMSQMAEQVKAGKESKDLGEQILDDSEELDLRAEVMGDTEQEMIDDGLPAVFIGHVFHTLIVHHSFGAEVAKAVWEDVPNGPKAKPQDRKPKSQRGTSGKGSTTKRPASSTPTSESTPASAGDES